MPTPTATSATDAYGKTYNPSATQPQANRLTPFQVNATPGMSQADSNPQAVGGPTPISVDTMGKGSSSPITLPPTTPYTPPVHNVQAPAGTTTDANGKAVVPPPAPTNASSVDAMKGLIGQLGTEGATQSNLETQAGTDQLLKQKTADYNAYTQAKIDQTNTIAAMRSSNPEGQDKFGVDASVARYQLESDAHISNLAIQSQISSGNYTDAEATITKKLDAMFTPIKDQISALTSLSTLENNDMTESEKFAATQKAAQLTKDSDNLYTTEKDIGNTLMKNGNYSSVAPKLDQIHQDFVNGKIDATTAQNQMYAAASPYGVANLAGAGGAGANLPTVSMAANNAPDPAAQSQFLSSLPGGATGTVATLIKGLTDYTVNPDDFATRLLKNAPGMTRSDAMALAHQYDPTFDETQWKARQTLLKNFKSGAYSQNVNALNTAVGHLADIPANFAKLGNAGFTPYNWIKNGIASTFGSGAVTGASTNINAATGELASTFKSGGATDSEIKNLGTVGTNSSPAQAKAFVQTSINLLGSRLNALTDTYQSGMGKAPVSSFLSPTNMATLSNLKNQGYDVNIKGVYFTDPLSPKLPQTLKDQLDANNPNSVRRKNPDLTPAQVLQYAQYLQENGQL